MKWVYRVALHSMNEMVKLEAEFSEVHYKAQEYLDSRKGELSNLATDASENTRRRRIEESVVWKSVEKQAKIYKNQLQECKSILKKNYIIF